MLHFSYVFQILLLYFYLLVGIQIFYLQSGICLKIEHTISHCLFRVMFEHLLPPTHPIAFIFATIHVQLSVLEDKIAGNATALRFSQLNVSKKPKGTLNMPLQSSLKLKVSRSLLLPCSQQRKALVPHINQRRRNTVHLPIVP